MKKKDIKPLLGKMVKYKSNRTKDSLLEYRWGEVQEIATREVCIGEDWHDIKTLEIAKVGGTVRCVSV